MIYIFIGIPASGKSTETERLDHNSKVSGRSCSIISRDEIRAELAPHKKGKFIGDLHFEERVTGIFNKRLCKALKLSNDVIIDNMNVRPKYIKEILSYIKTFNRLDEVEFKFGCFTDDLNKCIELNSQRSESEKVPEHAIRKSYETYKANKSALEKIIKQLKDKEFVNSIRLIKELPHYCPFEVKPVVANDFLPATYIFDIDGTLAAHNRNPYEYNKCNTDSVIEPTARILRELSAHTLIVIMSGRPKIDKDGNDICYMTHDWLEKNNIPYNYLYMREEGDDRNDAIVKYELFNHHIRDQYNVLGVFDDRLRVLAMWEELGVPVYNVNNGMGEY